MIRDFCVENFRSIKTKQTISFDPNKKINYGIEDYVLMDASEDDKLLKFIVLYGYNASGKSTILDAIDFVRSIQLHFHVSKREQTGFVPFLFDEKIKTSPGKFTLNFYIDKILYHYFISLDNKIIYKEELSFKPEGRKAIIFERYYDEHKKTSSLIFSPRCNFSMSDKLILTGNTTNNNTVLSSYDRSNVNSEEFDKVYRYFNENLVAGIKPATNIIKNSLNQMEEDKESQNFYSTLLKKADFQIDDVDLIDGPDTKKRDEIKKIVFEHSNDYGKFTFPSSMESNGTMRFFGLESIMYQLVNRGVFMAIDEFDTSLHSALVSEFIKIYLANSTQSQLIITTNDMSLMDKEYMRRDMMYLCEKQKDGSSTYRNIQQFKLHKRILIEKRYREGSLGAVPHYGSTSLNQLNEGGDLID